MRAGQDRYTFARIEKAITVTDALIAAAAWEHHAILVTNNLKDYPMPDVQLLPLDGQER
ncbi:PIN domain protein (fragment) [Nitrolancea hollandica]|uniref:PIN domain protein n=1 Tax=Nitrolancea hollandica Lb TaxID=1129897 RepID=I4EEE6_9BACT